MKRRPKKASKTKSVLSRADQKIVKRLAESLKRKVLFDPTGLEPPPLAALIDRVQWALLHEGNFTEKYITQLWEDLDNVENCLSTMRHAMLAHGKDKSKTLLVLLAAKDSQ